MKREIPILITLVAGMFMLIAWFVPHPMVRGAYEGLQNWAIVVVGFTYVLGVGALSRTLLSSRIAQRRAGRVAAGTYVALGLVAAASGERLSR